MLDDYNGFYYAKNKRIALTLREIDVLAYFVDNRGKVITPKDICEAIYGEYTKKNDSTIRAYICFLNKKLKGEICIRAVKSVGYKIEYLGD